MCLALLRLDFGAAFRANQALFLLLPAGALLAGWQAARYLRFGSTALTRAQTLLVYVMIAALVAFGVLRNLPPFEFLRPA